MLRHAVLLVLYCLLSVVIIWFFTEARISLVLLQIEY